MDNGLINGTNVYGGKGKRYEINFKAGKTHRLRLVNTAMDTHFKVAIDKHTMKVIAADFVPIVPFDTEMLSIGIGQRYDVLVHAPEKSGNFWFRAHVQTGCGQHGEGPIGELKEQDVRAIVRYDTNTGDDRKNDPAEIVWPDFGNLCEDMPMSKLEPIVQIDVPASDIEHAFEFNQVIPNGVYFWDIKGEAYRSPWDHPSRFSKVLRWPTSMLTHLAALQQISENITKFEPKQLVTELEGKDKWVYIVVNTSAQTVR
jgi:hypothetical protein